MDKISVLDKGYVLLKDYMGSDLTVVNCARCSYDKDSTELSERDIRLIDFLGREGHTSPSRHAVLQFEVYAPLVVARQWWKHVIGCEHGEGYDRMTAWNESSRRYITEEPVFYQPAPYQWRTMPENAKQGSGEPLAAEAGQRFSQQLTAHIDQSIALYEQALAEGVCAEQARLFLPAYGLYVRWVWTTSLQATAHFVGLRLDGHAQKEIREYAEAVKALTAAKFPHGLNALLVNR